MMKTLMMSAAMIAVMTFAGYAHADDHAAMEETSVEATTEVEADGDVVTEEEACEMVENEDGEMVEACEETETEVEADGDVESETEVEVEADHADEH